MHYIYHLINSFNPIHECVRAEQGLIRAVVPSGLAFGLALSPRRAAARWIQIDSDAILTDDDMLVHLC